ncbi:unnamed protein product [Closterium sp. Yama58-4]|nr:unnamed protein product [Closterium sp. Yama58-4]
MIGTAPVLLALAEAPVTDPLSWAVEPSNEDASSWSQEEGGSEEEGEGSSEWEYFSASSSSEEEEEEEEEGDSGSDEGRGPTSQREGGSAAGSGGDARASCLGGETRKFTSGKGSDTESGGTSTPGTDGEGSASGSGGSTSGSDSEGKLSRSAVQGAQMRLSALFQQLGLPAIHPSSASVGDPTARAPTNVPASSLDSHGASSLGNPSAGSLVDPGARVPSSARGGQERGYGVQRSKRGGNGSSQQDRARGGEESGSESEGVSDGEGSGGEEGEGRGGREKGAGDWGGSRARRGGGKRGYGSGEEGEKRKRRRRRRPSGKRRKVEEEGALPLEYLLDLSPIPHPHIPIPLFPILPFPIPPFPIPRFPIPPSPPPHASVPPFPRSPVSLPRSSPAALRQQLQAFSAAAGQAGIMPTQEQLRHAGRGDLAAALRQLAREQAGGGADREGEGQRGDGEVQGDLRTKGTGAGQEVWGVGGERGGGEGRGEAAAAARQGGEGAGRVEEGGAGGAVGRGNGWSAVARLMGLGRRRRGRAAGGAEGKGGGVSGGGLDEGEGWSEGGGVAGSAGEAVPEESVVMSSPVKVGSLPMRPLTGCENRGDKGKEEGEKGSREEAADEEKRRRVDDGGVGVGSVVEGRVGKGSVGEGRVGEGRVIDSVGEGRVMEGSVGNLDGFDAALSASLANLMAFRKRLESLEAGGAAGDAVLAQITPASQAQTAGDGQEEVAPSPDGPVNRAKSKEASTPPVRKFRLPPPPASPVEPPPAAAFLRRDPDELAGVTGRIRSLEQLLAATRAALRQGREALSRRDAELEQMRSRTMGELLRLTDSLEFRESEMLRTRAELRSTRAEVTALEGRFAAEFRETRRVLEEKDQQLGELQVAYVQLRPTRVVWPNPGNEVLLTGSFNGWTNRIKMVKSNAGVFVTTLHLYPGQYEVKFIVDGNWKPCFWNKFYSSQAAPYSVGGNLCGSGSSPYSSVAALCGNMVSLPAMLGMAGTLFHPKYPLDASQNCAPNRPTGWLRPTSASAHSSRDLAMECASAKAIGLQIRSPITLSLSSPRQCRVSYNKSPPSNVVTATAKSPVSHLGWGCSQEHHYPSAATPAATSSKFLEPERVTERPRSSQAARFAVDSPCSPMSVFEKDDVSMAWNEPFFLAEASVGLVECNSRGCRPVFRQPWSPEATGSGRIGTDGHASSGPCSSLDGAEIEGRAVAFRQRMERNAENSKARPSLPTEFAEFVNEVWVETVTAEKYFRDAMRRSPGARGGVVRGAARQNLHHHLSLLFAFILVFSSSHHLSANGGAFGGGADASALPELSSYSSMALLDPRFELYWSTNTSDATIHMAARAQTAGWLAIGLSESGGMFGSDVMVAWVAEKEGRVYATDRFVFNKTMEGVALDDQQDWRVLGGSQTTDQSTGDTWTTVHVWRQLDTGDCNDRPITAGALSFVIWAMGTTDELAYHSETRGATSLVLLPAPGPSILDPATPPTTTAQSTAASWPAITSAGKLAAYAQGQANGQKNGQAKGQGVVMGDDGRFNLTMVNHRVSTNYTTYMCKTFDLPLTAKRHITQFGIQMNSSLPSVLHHVLLFGCPLEEYQDVPATQGVYECMHESAPCMGHTVAMWGLGARPYSFPPDVGYPIGPGYYTKFVLQIHYTNPDGRSDIIDNSGIFLETSAPGKHDAGIMMAGPVYYGLLLQIPPGQPSWTQENICPGRCTKAVFKNESVNIVAAALHQHALGRQMYTDVYRDGAKVTTVARLDYYDFASQQMIRVQPPFQLQPGDELRTKCVWDSTSRSNVTMGGEASNEEMCISFLVYYPAYRDKREMRSCVAMCADISTGKLNLDPTSPKLMSFAVCGTGTDRERVKLGFSKCNISYGESQPLSVLHGCPSATALSLADIPKGDISVPINTTPDPLTPTTNCTTNTTATATTTGTTASTDTGTTAPGSSNAGGGKGAAAAAALHGSSAALLATVAAFALAILL